MINEDADTLKQWLFTPYKDLPEGVSRPALKTIHINKCPVVVPEKTLNDEAAARLDIDRELHHQHLTELNAAGDLTAKINAIFTKPEYDSIDDPDAGLYSGGFFSASDKRKMELIREAEPENLSDLSIPFEDNRLEEMLFRYRARNWPETLNEAEQEEWQHYRQQRLTSQGNDKILTLRRFQEAIVTCRERELSENQLVILHKLDSFSNQVKTVINT